MHGVRAPAGRARRLEVPVQLVLSLVVIGAVVVAWAHVCVHLAALEPAPGRAPARRRCACAAARRPAPAARGPPPAAPASAR